MKTFKELSDGLKQSAGIEKEQSDFFRKEISITRQFISEKSVDYDKHEDVRYGWCHFQYVFSYGDEKSIFHTDEFVVHDKNTGLWVEDDSPYRDDVDEPYELIEWKPDFVKKEGIIEDVSLYDLYYGDNKMLHSFYIRDHLEEMVRADLEKTKRYNNLIDVVGKDIAWKLCLYNKIAPDMEFFKRPIEDYVSMTTKSFRTPFMVDLYNLEEVEKANYVLNELKNMNEDNKYKCLRMLEHCGINVVCDFLTHANDTFKQHVFDDNIHINCVKHFEINEMQGFVEKIMIPSDNLDFRVGYVCEIEGKKSAIAMNTIDGNKVSYRDYVMSENQKFVREYNEQVREKLSNCCIEEDEYKIALACKNVIEKIDFEFLLNDDLLNVVNTMKEKIEFLQVGKEEEQFQDFISKKEENANHNNIDEFYQIQSERIESQIAALLQEKESLESWKNHRTADALIYDVIHGGYFDEINKDSDGIDKDDGRTQ